VHPIAARGRSSFMSVPQVSAAQAVGEYLQSPDDLAKIVAFKKKLEKEKASIDTRLKNGVKEQLIATREGLRKLLGTRDNVQAIKDEMVGIERGNNVQINVQTFEQISRVSSVSFMSDGDQIIFRYPWCIGIFNLRKRWFSTCFLWQRNSMISRIC
jgi:hypothetical protein